jgi:tRNA pseudouridine55 synthase
MMGRRRTGAAIHGWLIIDKPLGLTSSQVVGRVRRILNAEKVGHAGTLDPLATGVLPIALGEATKTVSFAMDRRKSYRFEVRWGEARTTDDAEGEIVKASDRRPTAAELDEVLPRFRGLIQQRPPIFSAIKLNGDRAYDLARSGEATELQPRQIQVHELRLTRVIDADHAEFEVVSGKGCYIRSLARDIAEALGSYGHVVALCRLSVGAFALEQAISLDDLAEAGHGAALASHLLPLQTALDDIPALALTEAEAHRLKHGQALSLFSKQDKDRLDRCGIGPADTERTALALSGVTPVALVRIQGVEVRPVRVLNIS